MNSEMVAPLEPSDVDTKHRVVAGYAAPYNETSKLTPHPGGERFVPGAFAASLKGRQVFLNLCHQELHTVGRSILFQERPEGLYGAFHIRKGPQGDQVLEEAADGYWPGMSVGFREVSARRGADGAHEVTEAWLGHVALVRAGAYQTALVTGVARNALEETRAWLAWAKAHRPEVDLSPLPQIPGMPPPWWYGRV